MWENSADKCSLQGIIEVQTSQEHVTRTASDIDEPISSHLTSSFSRFWKHFCTIWFAVTRFLPKILCASFYFEIMYAPGMRSYMQCLGHTTLDVCCSMLLILLYFIIQGRITKHTGIWFCAEIQAWNLQVLVVYLTYTNRSQCLQQRIYGKTALSISGRCPSQSLPIYMQHIPCQKELFSALVSVQVKPVSIQSNTPAAPWQLVSRSNSLAACMWSSECCWIMVWRTPQKVQEWSRFPRFSLMMSQSRSIPNQWHVPISGYAFVTA